MSSEGSLLGLALQTAKGTPNVTDASFHYFLYNNSSIAPSNVTLPVDTEVGGGALMRDVKKMGVMSGGAIEFVPRPLLLGYLLKGALGKVVTAGASAPYSHAFTLDANQFAAPYFTLRSAPGNMWGEQMQDQRVSALGLSFRGADFVRAQAAFTGGLPTKVATTTWDAATKVDSGPQFIAPLSKVELPTGTSAKVLQGSFMAGMSIPMDEQWVVGNYSPDDFEILQRAFSVSLTMKVADATLYSKMMYDPAGGSVWVSDMLREADLKIELVSDALITAGNPYKLTIAANGETGADANVIWSVAPIGVRAGRQILMNATGLFIASPVAAAPITVTLVNNTASYAT
jgi:hypothetical protein